MKTILAALRRAPKRAAGLFVVLAAIAIPAGLLAWGPNRPTYTLENPADHVTFNSITNNRKHGDERNFIQIREVGGNYTEEVKLQPGKEYEVYSFYHNNAKSSLNSAEHNYKGIAINTKMRAQLPQSVKKGEKARFTSFVSADNAQPKEVWDEAYGVNNTDGDLVIRIVPGSAKITSEGKVNGKTMPDSFFSTGALLGYDELNGKVPGCNEYSGYVIYRIKVGQPNFEVKKQVAKTGEKQFHKEISINAGEIVDYKIEYKNTGTIQQNNVVIKDVLPKGVSYIPGSTLIANSKTGSQWKPAESDAITTGGINIGSYAPGGNAFVKFSAKINDLSALDCGDNKLVNTAYVNTENGSKKDMATVVVKKECTTPNPPAKYTCDALAINKLSDNRYSFETGYKIEGGTFKSVTYVVRDANGNEVSKVNGTPNKSEYTQAKPGKYSVEAVVTFVVDNKEVTATGDNCKKEFTVPATPPAEKEIEVCELSTKKYPVKIKESEFDSSKHSKNPEDCKTTPTPNPEKIEVCRLSDKTVVSIDKSEYEANKDRYSTNLDDCKETPTVPEQPVENCPIPGKEHLPKDSPDCKEVCEVPGKSHLAKNSPECITTADELPRTGGLGLAVILSLGMATAGVGYYLAGRRNQLNETDRSN